MCKVSRVPQSSRGRAVVGIGPDLRVEFYKSSIEAERMVGCPHSSISNRCSRRIKNRYLSERIWFWEDDSCWNTYINKHQDKACSHDSIYETLYEIILQYIPHAQKNREFKINGGIYMYDLYEKLRGDINQKFGIKIERTSFNPSRDFTIQGIKEIVVRCLLNP